MKLFRYSNTLRLVTWQLALMRNGLSAVLVVHITIRKKTLFS
jgi:hypothetical protein